MKIIKVSEIEGVLCPERPVKSLGFGVLFNGNEWMIFENEEEREKHTPVIVIEVRKKSLKEKIKGILLKIF